MSELDQFKQTYFLECAELLDVLEEQFTDIEGGDYEPEALHAVFRAIHSIKGGAGAFGFDGLVSFTHSFETMLDLARDGDLDLTPEIVALCLRANDIVSDMVSAAQSGETLDESFGEEVRKEIEAASGVEPEGEGVSEFDDLDFVPVMVPMDAPASDTVDSSASTAGLDDMADLLGEIETTEADGPTRWLINFRPHKSLFERANEPLLLFRELSELGEMAVEPIVDEIPDFFDLDPLVPFIAWTITLTTDQSRDAIEEVFEFVDGDCDLDIHREGEAVTPDAEEASDLSFEALAASVMDTGSAESSADAGGGDDAPDAMSFA
ncbi:MAG: Hpt domain-containing protein, partial [Pseudomonadota bacterium]